MSALLAILSNMDAKLVTDLTKTTLTEELEKKKAFEIHYKRQHQSNSSHLHEHRFYNNCLYPLLFQKRFYKNLSFPKGGFLFIKTL